MGILALVLLLTPETPQALTTRALVKRGAVPLHGVNTCRVESAPGESEARGPANCVKEYWQR